MCQPGWERCLGKNGYMYLCGWIPSLFTWNYHNIVNWLFCCSVAQSCLTLCDPHGLQHVGPPCPSPSSEVYPSSCPLHWWCHPAISSSDILFSFCPQSFPTPVSQLFASNDQNTGVSASASVLPMSIQGWFLLRLTGLISLLSKGLQEPFPAPQFQSINSLVLCLLYGPALTTVCDHWEDHSIDYTDICWHSVNWTIQVWPKSNPLQLYSGSEK